MRMTQNKRRALEAAGHIDREEGFYPPHNATSVQWILREKPEYGALDLVNITRTLKALVEQGLLKCTTKAVDVSGDTGCVRRYFQQERVCYWPTDLDLDAMILKHKGTPEEQDLKWHNAFQRLAGLPMLTMESSRRIRCGEQPPPRICRELARAPDPLGRI